MKPVHRLTIRKLNQLSPRVAVVVGAMLLAGCQFEAPASRDTPSMLGARGTGARIIEQEWWFLFVLSLVVFIGVMGLFGYLIYRDRRYIERPDLGVDMRDPGGRMWIWIGGIAMPVVVLSAAFGFSMRSMVLLQDPPDPEAITIEVVGHRWWWEVRYPDAGIVMANQIHVPVGEPVRINVTSNDVIHSFWVPQVHRKIDMNPGETNTIWLQADEPGVYRGICAEFCGLQHARMHFMLVAQPPNLFAQWLEHQRQPAPPPETPLAQRGQEVFLGTTCLYCHTIRGTPAVGTVGPDLTHFASRHTLAAGALENNPGNLGGWIIDPQHIKPGALMPPANLSGEDLQALLAYLQTLR